MLEPLFLGYDFGLIVMARARLASLSNFCFFSPRSVEATDDISFAVFVLSVPRLGTLLVYRSPVLLFRDVALFLIWPCTEETVYDCG